MNDPADIRRERLEKIERRIDSHPGLVEHLRLAAFARTLGAVFLPNWREVLALLDRAANDGELAMELVQNVRSPTVREQFRAETIQRLHNYVAGTSTLIDHSQRLIKGRSGPIVSEFEAKKRTLLQNPEVPFVRDLRNFTTHYELPGLGHTVRFENVNASDASMSSEVELSVEQLLLWREWKPASRQFLESQGDKIALRPVLVRHGQLMTELNEWLLHQLVAANADALSQVDKLAIERAAIFLDTDVATAERMIRDRKAQMASGEPSA